MTGERFVEIQWMVVLYEFRHGSFPVRTDVFSDGSIDIRDMPRVQLFLQEVGLSLDELKEWLRENLARMKSHALVGV